MQCNFMLLADPIPALFLYFIRVLYNTAQILFIVTLLKTKMNNNTIRAKGVLDESDVEEEAKNIYMK